MTPLLHDKTALNKRVDHEGKDAETAPATAPAHKWKIKGAPSMKNDSEEDHSTAIDPARSTERRCRSESSQGPGSCATARRKFLETALVAGLGLSLADRAQADESPTANERPQAGDRFVFAEGDHEGTEIKPSDLPAGGPPVQAWPKDPKSNVVRDGSRLNQVLLLRLDPARLDVDTRPHAADGIVAYSAICTHQQCPVTGWVEDQGRHVLKCFCHNSEYDPRQNAKVIFGPAPRNLPALPVKIESGTLVAAGTFLGRVGRRPS